MKTNIFNFYLSNAPFLGKDIIMLYSIAITTTTIFLYIVYKLLCVINLSVLLVPVSLLSILGVLYSSLKISYSDKLECRFSIYFPTSVISYLMYGLFFIILYLYLEGYENINPIVGYDIFLTANQWLLYVERILMPFFFWYNVVVQLFYYLDTINISRFYTWYKSKLTLLHSVILELEKFSNIITYLVKFSRIVLYIIDIVCIGLIIYKYIESSLCFLDILHFLLFLHCLYEVISLFHRTEKTQNSCRFYLSLLFYLFIMAVCYPGFSKVTAVLLSIVNFEGKGKGKALNSPDPSSNPSSPPPGPNPPSGPDPTTGHAKSNNNQDNEEQDDSNEWERYNVNTWEHAVQENANPVAGPSETAKERNNRLRRERRAARTPAEIAKDLEKARGYDKKRRANMSLEKKEAKRTYLQNRRNNRSEDQRQEDREYMKTWKDNRSQEKKQQDNEKERIRMQNVKDNMTPRQREQYLDNARVTSKTYWDNLPESGKEERRVYNRNYYGSLSEEKKLDYDIRKEKNWKKNTKKNQKDKKDKDTSNKKDK